MERDTLTGRLDALMRRMAQHAHGRRAERVVEKASIDYVSDLDHELDAMLSRELPSIHDAVVFSEERPFGAGAAPDAFWMIDPLDGTHNFLAGLPHFAIAAALFQDSEVVLSAVGDIDRGDVYSAWRGGGAWLNGRRLASGDGQLIGVSTGAMDLLARRPDVQSALRARGKFRNFGSQALHLCYVARGSLLATASAEARIWDDAAARLIAEEAGARYRSNAAGPWTLADPHMPLKSLCAHAAAFDALGAVTDPLWT